jgi:heme-degrading monooxygenase HmoA
MIALLFEVLPKPGREDRYLEMAAALRPEVEKSGGLVFIDRFRNQTRPGWILSHQLWCDEECLARWRAHPAHRAAQLAGRTQHFVDYRIRIADVIRETVAGDAVATVQQQPSGKPISTAQRLLGIVASRTEPFAASGAETFMSLYQKGEFLAVAEAATAQAGEALIRRAMAAPHVTAARLCRVVRDYGMGDRAEAP